MKTQSRSNIVFPLITSVTAIAFTSILSALVLVNTASAESVDNKKPVIDQSIQQDKNIGKKALSQDDVMSRVNVNNADAQMLSDSLKGVGLKKAQAIVEWRVQNGDFVALEQLLEVKGIGEKTLQANRPLITL
jgi:competence protein ComEA